MDAIKPTDLGFIDPKTNTLRSKDELKPLDSERSSKSSNSEATSNDTSVRSALANEKVRVNTQVNDFVSVLNQNVDNLKSAKKNLKALKSKAKEIKQAIKSGDNESAEALRKEFSELQSKRDSLATKISEDNRELSPSTIQSIQVGNETRATFRTDAVEFSGSISADTSSVKSINAFIDETNDEIGRVQQQLDDEKVIRKEVRQVNKSVRKELNAIGRAADNEIAASINNIQEAGLVADNIATQVASQATLENTITSNVDSAVAEKLLKF